MHDLDESASKGTDGHAVRARVGGSAVASACRAGGGHGWWINAGVQVVVFAIVVIAGASLGGCSSGGQDTNPALLVSQAGQTGAAVDDIPSSAAEQTQFHIHTHLQIYVNGAQKLIPYGVGIVAPYQLTHSQNGPFVNGGKAFYWLHTHDETGVIHIESPVRRGFTLGNFFDIWGQPLSPDQVGPAHGTVTAFINGQPVSGNPRGIELYPHAVIQLNVGTPTVPPQPYTFAPDLS
jgi:hypothetical protein